MKLENVLQIKKSKYTGSSIVPYIGLEHIGQGTMTLVGQGLSSEVSSDKYLFESGDILFGKLRPYFKKVVKPKFNGICSTEIWVIQAKEGFDQDYLFYFLSTNKFVDLATQASKGTRMPRADWNFLKNTEWNFPPLPEQKRIANILSSFDNKIELLKEQNKTLENIAQTIFKQWFIDFNFPDSNGKPYKDNGGEMVDSELGMIPKGWVVGKLGDITTITSGKGLSKDKYDKTGQYEVLGANGSIGKTNMALFNKKLIFTGRVGTLGNVFLSNKPAWYSDNTLIILPKEKYLYYVFRFLQTKKLERLDRGSTQPLITQTDLKSILLNIPDKKSLDVFTKMSSVINDKIITNEENVLKSDIVKTTLLNKFFN